MTPDALEVGEGVTVVDPVLVVVYIVLAVVCAFIVGRITHD